MPTKLPPNANELVAQACGFTKYPGAIYYKEWRRGHFAPATDPAAAMFALEAYCKNRKMHAEMFYNPHLLPVRRETKQQHFSVRLTSWRAPLGYKCVVHEHGGSFCHAICLAILAAEEGRNKSNQTS